MEDWQEKWKQMRAQFMTRARERLGQVETLLRELRSCRSADVLGQVRQHFHWLSGVGGTYKLPEVSDIGVQGEQLCDQHLDAGSVPSDQEVEELQRLLSRVKQKIDSAI